MPVTIPDNLKRISCDAAKALFFSRLRTEVGLDVKEAEKIADWMAGAYEAGWTDGVKQSITLLNHAL